MANTQKQQKQNSHAGKGITDWGKKKEALCTLFGQWSDRELAIAILGMEQKPSNYTQDVESLRGSFKSWFNHKPTGGTGTRFMLELTKRLIEVSPALNGQDESFIRTIILKGSIEEFHKILPKKMQDILETPYKKSEITDSITGIENEKFYPHWFAREVQQESIHSSLTRGRIDQKFHYLNPDAVEIWRDVVNTGVYRQYDECKAALDYFFESGDVWQRFFREQGADGAIMLGCGAGSKDMLIILSMLSLSDAEKMNYALVDFSPYMLRSAYHLVDNMLKIDELSARVNLTIHEIDFVNNFIGAGEMLTRKGKNVAWLLPGGTIGNLNEKRLFESVYAESQTDDLFVIGAETVDMDEKIELNAIKDKYDTPAVRRFVEMPFRSVLRGLHIDKLPPIEVNVVDGHEYGHSEIKGAKTVEVSSNVKGKKLVLLTSTRYNEGELVEFAAQKGFKNEAIISSPLNQRYKQFVFRRA